MEKIETAVANLKAGLITGGATEQEAANKVEEFRNEVFLNNNEAIANYCFDNNSSMLDGIIDALNIATITTELKDAFKNDLN